MRRLPRSKWIAIASAIAIATIFLLAILAPLTGTGQEGSTYGRNPSGYGAWYAYLQQQNIAVERWQKKTT